MSDHFDRIAEKAAVLMVDRERKPHFTYEHKGDGSPPIRHIVNPDERDATLCEELIEECVPQGLHGTCEGFHYDTGRTDVKACSWCQLRNTERVLDIARRQVAQELGVDESEVF